MIITIYTRDNCAFCDRAKSLLESRGVVYNAINIDNHTEAREFLIDQGLRSVPQIFNGTALIQGGFQGLASQPDEFWTQFQGQ